MQWDVYGPGPGAPHQKPEGTLVCRVISQGHGQVNLVPTDRDEAVRIMMKADPDSTEAEVREYVNDDVLFTCAPEIELRPHEGGVKAMTDEHAELARLAGVTGTELERLGYDVVIRLSYDDPAAQKAGSRFILIAKCRTSLVAEAIVRDYEDCGWVKGIAVFGPEDEAEPKKYDARVHGLGA